MHPKEIEKKIEQAAALNVQEHHPESLAILEDIKTFLPNSPVLFSIRVENLAALGRTNEALHDCGRLLQRLNQIRDAGNSLDDLLDIEQAERLAEFVTEQTDQASTLKRTLDRRQADALDKETLQSTVADLEAKLNAFLNQREQASQDQKNLLEELDSLREKERTTTEALEKAYTELDTLKHTLVKREAEISEAENELAQREQLVVRLEKEVQSLQERSESAVHAEELLNEELKRLKQQGDQKSEALEQARRELEELHQSLKEREKSVEEAKAQNLANESALKAMREEMDRIHDEAQIAEHAKETLQSELDQLRKTELEKSDALESARIQLSSMQDMLQDREKNVAEAENRARATEQEKAALREQLNEIVKRAETAAASEYALADEVALLRSNEAEKAAELERTRDEMERMRAALEGREKALQQHIQKSELSSEAEKNLREELEAIRGRSREFAESEKHLAEELEHLRQSESKKSKTLENARTEMETLRLQLSKQQEAVATAEEASLRYDAIVSTLQQELHSLQEQVQHASSSEQELAQELSLLRENESSKTQALAEAQAEMEDLRSRLVQRETEAREAEVVNAQKQRELEQLHLELELLRARTDETRDTESTLTQEIGKLRQSEMEKNRELEQSRKELESLKQVLTEREEAASKAAQEQESSREIIQQLENELALLRHKDMERQSSQQAFQEEVTQIKDAVQRQGTLEDSPQARKLKEIQEQLQTLEESRLDNQQALRAQAAKLALQQSSQRQTPRDAALLAGQPDLSSDSQLFALNSVMPGAPQTKTQIQALKLAQQQSQRQTQAQAAHIAQQQSQRQTQAQAARIAQQQSQRQTQTQAAQIAGQQQLSPSVPSPLSVIEEALAASTPSDPQQPPLPAADTSVMVEDDDFDSDVPETYPKPRDVSFVFPDQSCSIAVKRSRSSYRIYIAAGFLLLIAVTGIAAFVVQGMLSKPSDNSAATGETAKDDEVKMLRMEFPTDQPFGTLYDHSMQPASDAEWPPYAEAKGIVEYPETVKFHLVVRREHADDLSPLAKLPPRSLTSLWLPEFDMSEQNIRYLQSLERVSVIYIDQEMTDREKQLIAAGFKGDTTITSKMPGAIIREMTPPDKRVLTFPEGDAVGLLAIRTWNDPKSPWQYLDVARGAVEVPAGMEIQLKLSSNAPDLSFLREFEETTIHTLVLEGQNSTNAVLESAVELRGLIALELIDTAVGKAGMEALSAVSGLQQIKIQNSKMDDSAIEVFLDLPQLSTIEISNAPNITYKSLHLFRKLRALRRLHLQDTGISLEQVRELGRDLPACAVTPI